MTGNDTHVVDEISLDSNPSVFLNSGKLRLADKYNEIIE
jgi:hypothetical protein